MKKWLKWALWGLLGLLLLPLALVLLVLLILLLLIPFRYRVQAEKRQDTSVHARVSYFFGLVRVMYERADGQSQFITKIAWHTLGKNRKKKKISSMPSESSRADMTKKKPPRKMPPKAPSRALSDPLPPSLADTPPSPVPPPETSGGYYAKLKAVLTYPDTKTIIKLAWQCVKKTLRTLLPRKIDIEGTIGLECPATTAWIIGGYEAAAATLGIRRQVRLGADFITPGVYGQALVQGSLCPARLLWPTLRLVCKKPIHKLIFQLITDTPARKDDNHEQRQGKSANAL